MNPFRALASPGGKKTMVLAITLNMAATVSLFSRLSPLTAHLQAPAMLEYMRIIPGLRSLHLLLSLPENLCPQVGTWLSPCCDLITAWLSLGRLSRITDLKESLLLVTISLPVSVPSWHFLLFEINLFIIHFVLSASPLIECKLSESRNLMSCYGLFGTWLIAHYIYWKNGWLLLPRSALFFKI